MVNSAIALGAGLVAGLVGAGSSQTLEKLEISPVEPSQLPSFKVPFNPTSYQLSKSVTWSFSGESDGETTETQRDVNAPRRHFSGGGSRTLSFELFFDVTELIDGKKYADVRELTRSVVKLTEIERATGQPPICILSWGNQPIEGHDFPFQGFVSSLAQNFLLFDSKGTPVRARLPVTFTEFLEPEDDKRKTDPELTTHLVKRGDTLSSIAAEFYKDSTIWRRIAEANELDDPRNLQPGQSLSIPEL